jgi:hypothetical protein
MRLKMAIAALIVAGSVAVPAAGAFADSCTNVSRDVHAPGGTTQQAKGNWVWLPQFGIWGFAPPGAPDSVANALPGSNGNYQNTAVTGNQSLLDNSATCAGTNTARQQTNGIQTGCL